MLEDGIRLKSSRDETDRPASAPTSLFLSFWSFLFSLSLCLPNTDTITTPVPPLRPQEQSVSLSFSVCGRRPPAPLSTTTASHSLLGGGPFPPARHSTGGLFHKGPVLCLSCLALLGLALPYPALRSPVWLTHSLALGCGCCSRHAPVADLATHQLRAWAIGCTPPGPERGCPSVRGPCLRPLLGPPHATFRNHPPTYRSRPYTDLTLDRLD